MATNEQLQQQIEDLRRQIKTLEGLVNANEYTNLSVFLKQVLFKSKVSIFNLQTTTLITGDLYQSGGFVKIK